jgi:hypothetical protein
MFGHDKKTRPTREEVLEMAPQVLERTLDFVANHELVVTIGTSDIQQTVSKQCIS